jgi:nucleoside 2-deoxyribosyltransferase
MRPLIYIAGPFRAPTPWEIEQNVRRAEEYALSVAQLGGIPLCPHTMYRFYQNSLTDEFWLEAGLVLLRRCDAVVVTVPYPDSLKSAGTTAEIAEAESRGMPVFHVLGSLREWMVRQIMERTK